MTPGGPVTNTQNTIQNNCQNGINVGTGSTANLVLHNAIQGNGGTGVGVNGGNAVLSACCDPADNPGQILIQNNLRGIVVSAGGSANINAGNDLDGNPGTILIKDNKEWGVLVFGPAVVSLIGQTIVQNNMTTLSTAFGFALPAGIIASNGGVLFLSFGVQILNNHGPGILADVQSKVRLGSLPALPPFPPPLFPGITVSGNTADGVVLTHMSIAESFAGNTISGNTGADLTCYATSLLFGDVTGITVNKCANTEQAKKK